MVYALVRPLDIHGSLEDNKKPQRAIESRTQLSYRPTYPRSRQPEDSDKPMPNAGLSATCNIKRIKVHAAWKLT